MQPTMDRARFNMIEQQVRPWDVLDERVLTVMRKLPREAFVPDAYRGLAYADIEIPLTDQATMLAPKVVGRMLQALNVQPHETVLEIGTGTGYVTACLAHLGKQVFSIEIDPALGEGARARLDAMGLSEVKVQTADALTGRIDGAPFDVIAVTGSVPTAEPLAALEQLLGDGGRLFIVVGEPPLMEAMRLTRIGKDVRRESLFETSVTPLENAPQRERFTF
ncbi:MAG: protein-L-isoaspartate O-methyltransferase [Lamprobacter sp.]|uniref:protein-L-isoaspartate O-methyltransferase family protein n=1 Tax=Lamprobacter sp. TaxID=3100796 RepID=UPI002B261C3C|nr:protein-L-isoaspartate O-methyltransferase [Lamprobacter sp.]MEA3638965.1 protein-L-isoaspartate O-methyltransferase [Lamprobacter sp.]